MDTYPIASIRRAGIATLTALAIALPGLASAGPFDRISNKSQSVKARTTQAVSKVRQERPVASALQGMGDNLPDLSLIEDIQKFDPRQQFNNTTRLLKKMQQDYDYFSGGQGCSAECASFRAELKSVFNDYLALTGEVPALAENTRLVEGIQRVTDLIDFIPPRALYQLWQAIGSRIDDLQSVPQQMRQILAALPVMEAVSATVDTANSAGSRVADSRMCEWADKEQKPFIALYQARLERAAWAIGTVAELIPEIEVSGEVGVEAGVGVGMVTGSAEFTLKPTDALKIALKVLKVVPETINWSIKMNSLRADALCATADYAAGIGQS